jgi:hypothetical protein
LRVRSVQLAADGFEELTAELESVGRSKSPTLQLRDTGRAYVRFALRRPGHYRVMFGHASLPEEPPPRLVEAGARAYSLLERAVISAMPPSRAHPPERVRHAAFLAWSVVHGAASLVLDGRLGPLLSQSPATLG